jgi:hypothetical protein
MKTIQNVKTSEIRRVKDILAETFVNGGGFKYVNKTLWKSGAPIISEIEVPEVAKPKEQKNKKKK